MVESQRYKLQARLQSGEMKRLWKNYWALRKDRQQPAGEDGPCPEPTAAGRVVAAALGSRAAAVPQIIHRFFITFFGFI